MNDIARGTNQKNPTKKSKKLREKQKQDELHCTSLENSDYKTILIVDDEPDITYTLNSL